MNKPTLHVPTRNEIRTLKVGDLALDAFGRMTKVVKITCCREDIHGKLFACYQTEHGGNGSCSMSQKEGQLTRHVGTSAHYTSAQLDTIEADMLKNSTNSGA